METQGQSLLVPRPESVPRPPPRSLLDEISSDSYNDFDVQFVRNTTAGQPVKKSEQDIKSYKDYKLYLKQLQSSYKKYPAIDYIKYFERLEKTTNLLNENKRAFFVLGGPGTGKSGAVKKTEETFEFDMKTDESFIYLNTDDVMELLPQYIEGYDLASKDNSKTIYVDLNNADDSHKNAKKFADQMYKEAIAKNFSIVFDGTGNDKEKLRKKISNLVKDGYTVEIVHTLLDKDEAVKRASSRAYSSRRFVPNEVILDANPGTDKDEIATLICLPNIPLYFLDTSTPNNDLEKYTYSNAISCSKDNNNNYLIYIIAFVLIMIILYMYFSQKKKKIKKKRV